MYMRRQPDDQRQALKAIAFIPIASRRLGRIVAPIRMPRQDDPCNGDQSRWRIAYRSNHASAVRKLMNLLAFNSAFERNV